MAHTQRPTSACQFLGLKDDPETSFAFSDPGNFCYKAQPAQPVVTSYQEQVCLCPSACSNCPIAVAGWKGPLPAHIGSKHTLSPKQTANWILISSVLILAAFLIGWQVFSESPLTLPGISWFGFQTASASQGDQMQPSPTLVENPAPPLQSEIQASPTEISAADFNPAQPAATPTAAAVQEERPADPAVQAYLLTLHVVQPGESLATIARTYQTSPEVILAVNEPLFSMEKSFEAMEVSGVRTEDISLVPGLVAIVVPGRTNARGLPGLRVVEVSTSGFTASIASEYQVSLEDMIEYNAVGAEEWIPAGRLLILPATG